MLSVQEGKALIALHTNTLPPVTIPLHQAFSRVLATPAHAVVDVPAFDQSSMDGYAFRFDAWQQGGQLLVQGEMAAGATVNIPVTGSQAVRIFTGAPLPSGADTVVMQEMVKVEGERLQIMDNQLERGTHVRPAGAEIRKGALALDRGAGLTPAALAFLAGAGIGEVTVFLPPVISIILTGNELQAPGQPLRYGEVYESNSFSLAAALKQMQLDDISICRVNDELENTIAIIRQALDRSDLILITGGVSAGNYDYVAQAFDACGVETIFHKLKQRPGKPLLFGKKDHRILFGLPGNPSSVLTCFYEYVYPCIRQQMGYGSRSLHAQWMPLAQDLTKKPGLTHFLKGDCTGGTAKALQGQESYRMQSFAAGNCLICLPEEQSFFEKGSPVEVHVLPGYCTL